MPRPVNDWARFQHFATIYCFMWSYELFRAPSRAICETVEQKSQKSFFFLWIIHSCMLPTPVGICLNYDISFIYIYNYMLNKWCNQYFGIMRMMNVIKRWNRKEKVQASNHDANHNLIKFVLSLPHTNLFTNETGIIYLITNL